MSEFQCEYIHNRIHNFLGCIMVGLTQLLVRLWPNQARLQCSAVLNYKTRLGSYLGLCIGPAKSGGSGGLGEGVDKAMRDPSQNSALTTRNKHNISLR